MELSEPHKRRFISNLDLLRGIDPRLHEKLLSPAAGVALEMSEDGLLTAKKNGIYLESRTRPGRNARAYLERAPSGAETFVFLGGGLGYHVNALLGQALRKEAGGGGRPVAGILVERDLDLFRASLNVIDPEFLPRILPLVDLEPDDVQEAIRRLALRRVFVVKHPLSARLSGGYYAAVERSLLSKLKTTLATSVTERANRRLWTRNILKNLSHAGGRRCGTSGWRGSFAGPVLLVASGPYLEDAVGEIARLRPFVPMIALLPSFGFLARRGVAPDLLFTTDAGFWNRLRFADGVVPPLLAAYSAEPAVLRSWRSDVFLFSHGLPFEARLETPMRRSLSVPMQGTASGVLIRFARMMGFDLIFLACRGMKDHHAGAGFDDHLLGGATRLSSWHTQAAQRLRSDLMRRVPSQSGGETFSSHKLLLYRDWIDGELGGADLFRLNDGASMRNVRPLLDPDGGQLRDLRETFRPHGYREAFEARIEGFKGARIPGPAVEEDLATVARVIRERACGGSADRVFRFFFGEPLGEEGDEEIGTEASWAVEAFGKRLSGRRGPGREVE
jgi:hypothetical protein